VPYGPLVLNRPAVEMADGRYVGSRAATAPAAAVELYPVEPSDGVVRARASTLVVSGSGDGVVDAAAAGLLPDDSALVYSAATDPERLDEVLAGSVGLLVTDSNRARGRHWRGSQDTTGFTESGGRDGAAPTELTVAAVGDARLPVFAEPEDTVDPATQTTAEQRGPVIARASAYGQPFALLPEHRPFLAVDGDPTTAWMVGEHGNPIGATFELTLTDPATPPDHLSVEQYTGSVPQREITGLSLRFYDASGRQAGTTQRVEREPGVWPSAFDRIPLALPAGTVRITLTIDAVGGGQPSTAGALAGVGFSELGLGLGPTVEVVRPPSDALAAVDDETPLTLVFTRLRSDPADRWRDDPEPELVREIELTGERTFAVRPTVRLDRRATDQQLAELLDWPVFSTSRLLGRPEHAAPAAIDGDPATSWITGFDQAAGAILSVDAISKPVAAITVRQPVSGFTRATQLELTSADGQSRTVDLVVDAAGAATAVVDPPLPPGRLTIAISGIEPAFTIDRRFGDRFELPAAVTEIELAGLPALPDYSTPTALTDCRPYSTLDERPLSAALTTGNPDPAVPTWLGALDLVALACDPAGWEGLAIGPGTHVLESADTGLPVQLDRVVFAQEFRAAPAEPLATVTERNRFERTVEVTDCAEGCWLVLGEGYNDGWSAELAGADLGPPTLVDGGFNGWWIEPGAGTVTVQVRWTLQRPLTVAYVLSALAALTCVALIALHLRSNDRAPGPAPADRPQLTSGAATVDRRHAIAGAAAWAVAGGLLIGPWGVVWGALGGLGAFVLGHRRVAELTALATVLVLGAVVVLRERQLHPGPDGGWPHVFERYHELGVFAITAVVAAALCADDAEQPGPTDDGSLPSAP
jgi:arabinofuranan 3-O-arabinosyltransferase